MTIVAFHYTEKSIFTITDGLISRDGNRVIEKNVKIFQFTPSYKIPQISMGRLNGFGEYVGGPFCLAYAGNYTLIATIINEVAAVMSRCLVLGRNNENGNPVLYRRSDEGLGLRGDSYWDDYNFRNEELIDISMNFVADIVSKTTKKACIDFTDNAMSQPVVELLVFGQEMISYRSRNRAQFISCKKCEYGDAELVRYSVLPWHPFCFGERTSSEALRKQLESSNEFDYTRLTANFERHDSWGARPSEVVINEQNRISAIKKAVFELIAAGTSTIGGCSTIAEATWSQELQITTISHEAVVEAVDG